MSQTARNQSMGDLQINDLFWTLQGEGRYTGRRALFVRLPFCNYDCPWCDTEFNSYKTWTTESFIDFCRKEKARFAVITGGEPIAHKHLETIIKILKNEGFEIACETNGSLPVPDSIDFVTISPKAYTKKKHEPYYVHPDNFLKTHEWKYVVDMGFDFSILDRHPILPEVEYSLSPEFNHMEENTHQILDYIQKNPAWRLSLQTHKWIDIP